MKRSYRAVVLVLFTGLLIGSNPVRAELARNEMGLYADLSADPSATSIFAEPFTEFNAYLIVTAPYNYSFCNPGDPVPYEREMDSVGAFNCQIFIPEDELFVIGAEANSGEAGHIGSPPIYAYVFNTPTLVPENKIVLLMTFTFFMLDANPKEIYFGPSYHPGAETMEIEDPADDSFCIQAAYPSSGSYDMPVFGINTEVVAVEEGSWDGVKALFR